jgi:hypothetical protein
MAVVPARWHPPKMPHAAACAADMAWPAGAAALPAPSTPTHSGKQHMQVGGGAWPGPGVAPPTSSYATLHWAPCWQCTCQLCASGNQRAPTLTRPPPTQLNCTSCRAAANVTRSAAWSAGVAPPVITYLMAMNHEPVVNSGEVSG